MRARRCDVTEGEADDTRGEVEQRQTNGDGIAAARARCRDELSSTATATGRTAKDLLAEASRTPRGAVITNLDTCTRAGWLDVTAEKLAAMRLAAGPPAITPDEFGRLRTEQRQKEIA